MAGIQTGAPQTAHAGASRSYTGPLIALTSLFFLWGFITCLNDILIPHLKNVFQLNYTQTMLIQLCFFGAYFIVSLPAGALVKRISYKWGIVTGLLVAAIGCALFIPAASLRVYGLFLGALFVLAAGVTILQVAANPYVTVLGAPETASSRLTLTQAFNSLGTTVAPIFGAFLILSSATAAVENATPEQMDALRMAEAAAVKFPYLMLAIAFLVLAAIFAALKLPAVEAEEDAKSSDVSGSAWGYRHLVLGAVGIFLYVGAEVSIGSFLVNFMAEPSIAGLPEQTAAHYVSYFWGGAMIGRFIGSAVMRYMDDGKVLAFNAVAAGILLLVTVLTTGHVAMWCVLSIGFFNSIMFPTIFSLALKGLGRHTSQGSGILCLAIVGGALLPLVQGGLADTVGIHLAFLMPILCYVYIAYYGALGSRTAA
ncbi:L-fucose:H+ symporter permease [Agrobacterium vitis]|uniref:Glucose/galactose transporter n=2 Tax=Rhizobium/Agrobacterium group TaxID=227290 RepID=B9K0X4_ALLAM|nr:MULTISPECIES: L-fucose:H+ symporter permease [Rhizobium/Agrobacterium group]ACM38522.1 glucose/galactose transporter [Allorhizobium ampelinum S4]MCF1432739.1 L-fucose:H+ symporter permease [Allorhizobium ampelinum]MCF1445688.1 L-fucose:H+ symporter permease [Allorhizobium ampelinum]MCF1460701.1 L-fucose:H+ symporter permease [Allorhizobium ampelinum]MCF1491320.1 L-fucose:H+ symporter permease [Allorhizobium ampelinum]